MRFFVAATALVQLSAGLALPVFSRDLEDSLSILHSNGESGDLMEGGGAVGGGEGGDTVGGGEGDDAAGGGEGEGEGGEGGEGGEEGEENEVEIEAAFDEVVALEGGDLKQDTLYPPGASPHLPATSLFILSNSDSQDNGVFEVEFQNTVGNSLTVSTNANPAAPPAGFENLEATSFVVSLTDDAAGATLQKIDYILNADSALDISQGKVGKLDAATDTFIIDDTIGELEFEVEENELTLSVADLNGEWAVFVPVAGGGAGGGAGDGAGDGAGGDAGGGAGDGAGGDAGGGAGGEAPTTGNSILDSVLKLIGEGAATADAAAGAA